MADLTKSLTKIKEYLTCYGHFNREIFSEYREIYDITPSKQGLCSRSMKMKWGIYAGCTNPGRFGPGSFRPGSFRPNLWVGRFGIGRWVDSTLGRFGQR